MSPCHSFVASRRLRDQSRLTRPTLQRTLALALPAAMLRTMTDPICTEFSGDVPTSVQTAWDAFADTERFGRLTGMDMQFSYQPGPDGSTQRIGRMRSMGVTLIWDEAPVVFDAPRHYAILRKYRGGPAERYESELSVTPTAQGAHVAMVFRFVPRNALTAVAIRLQTALVVRPQLSLIAALLDRLIEREVIRPITTRALFFLVAHGAEAPFTLVALSAAFDHHDGPLDVAQHVSLTTDFIMRALIAEPQPPRLDLVPAPSSRLAEERS